MGYNAIYYYFILFYAVFFMGGAIYGTFIPVYLDYIGYSKSEIGILMSLGPFVAIIAQPFWGITSDRARSKNLVLQILFLAGIFVMVLFPLSRKFYYLILVITLFTFFQTSMGSISDTITLEYLSDAGQKFGPIRMAGTIGYAVMSVVAGFFAQRYIGSIFVLNIIVMFLAFMIVFKLPVVKGHQFGREHIPIWKLFSNKNLVILMVLNFLVQVTLGFYYTYFPLYFKQLGGSNGLLGWSYFISAMSEIPFLLYADKILKKIGTKYALLGATLVAAIRWLLIFLVTKPYVFLPLQLLHGLIFIVLYYSMATYINEEVPKELKASGQTVNNLIGMGISRIVGSLLGGFLSDIYSMKTIFLLNSILAFVTALVFGYMFLRWKRMQQIEDTK